MHYREIQPQPSLSRFIECFWTLESEPNAVEMAEPILPDGCVELILNSGEPFHQISESGEQVKQPAHFVVGQMTRPVLIAPAGSVELIGIRFNPGGTMPFLQQPLHELTNRIVELGSLNRALESELRCALTNASSSSERINRLQSCLIRRAQRFTGDQGFLNLTANAVRFHGRIRIDELADSAGVSGRQLERRFLAEIGIGPKMFCRILRFQQVFRAVEEDGAGWAAVAADCGYYDQAHLIRDFQEFAQQTPAVLLRQGSRLTEVFTRKHRRT
ncbi:MAG TPA: helix-turn-helix domain-containing protein [Pyrinomonadaceae bacterium]|nr:helix-turn-helix domain-containing protein [Pyrinomonadaceae bacterium]